MSDIVCKKSISLNKSKSGPPARGTALKSRTERQRAKGAEPLDQAVDSREQLVNDGLCGPIQQVSLPEEMITSLHGILLDIDPQWLNMARLTELRGSRPKRIYNECIQQMLERHPALAKAEVRHSGTGLHVIIRLSPAVEFAHAGDRQRWAAVIKIVQRLLPTDPQAPGITALTRPMGSVNSKNGKTVQLLKKGEPVSAEEVLELVEQARKAPFRTLMSILLGSERVSPCPICRAQNSSLAGQNHVGKCYGHCGTVQVGQLFDVFLASKS